jgi:hypothetical protein
MESSQENTKPKVKMSKQAFFRLIIFYLIAITVSNIFRFDIFHINNFLGSLPTWMMIFYSPLQASGVLLGALIAIKLLKKKSNTEISLWGTSKKWSLIMSIFPVALLLILGINNDSAIESHYYGLVAAFSTLIYCVFEEFGWRGYLEEELKNIPDFLRVLVIALLWYLWHLRFLTTTDMVPNIILLVALFFGSWGIGKIVKLTKSIVAAACIHMTINILLFNGAIKDGLGQIDKIIVLAVLIPIWILIVKRWKNKNKIAIQKDKIKVANTRS